MRCLNGTDVGGPGGSDSTGWSAYRSHGQWWLISPVRDRLPRVPPAVEDAALAAVIDVTAVRGTRRLTVVTVNLGDAGTSVRQAFIDADSDMTFEIGLVTKGLTGFLVAEAVTRGELFLDTHLESLLPQVADTAARAGGVHPHLRAGAAGAERSDHVGDDVLRAVRCRSGPRHDQERMLRSTGPVRCKSGALYAYSNPGAAVAGVAGGGLSPGYSSFLAVYPQVRRRR